MKELVLLTIAISLLYTVLPIISAWTFIKAIIKWDIRILKIWWFRTAIAIDKLGNVIGAPFFNDTFIKKGGYQFGNPEETISSILGKNQRDNTLTKFGSFFRIALDFIEKDHCFKSINNNLTNTRK
tara:strand:+ start:247 stop:624 length:378 start_codon:yes stop_codon:yes gene_type:complete